MRTRELIAHVVNRLDIKDAAILEAMAKVKDDELPEEFNAMPIDKIISIDNAHAIADVNKKVTNSYIQKQRTLMNARLRNHGFSDEEIEKFKDLNTEDYVDTVAKAVTERVEKNYTRDKSERESKLEAEIKELRDSHEKVKTTYDYKLLAMRAQQEEESINRALVQYVSRLPMNDEILTESTRVEIACRRIKEMAEHYNAGVKLVDGDLTLVGKDGSTLVMDGLKSIDFKDVTARALEKEGLLKATKNPPVPILKKQEPAGNVKVNRANQKFLNSVTKK